MNTSCWVLFVLTALATAAIADDSTSAPLLVPAFTAYGDPHFDDLKVGRGGITGWSDAGQSVVWFGRLAATGDLAVKVALKLPAGATSRLRLTVSAVDGAEVGTKEVDVAGAADPQEVDLGHFVIAAPGYHRFAVSGLAKSGPTFGDLKALELSAPAAVGAQFNLEERRNAASVHLGYPLPKGAQVCGFYCEVTPRAEPIYTYYEACGWQCGYFGMQVNSPTERRLIFSVWDNASEGKDRGKVKPEDLVHCLAKGDGVFAGGFGNEGTGGHSHLIYPWLKDQTYKFYMTVEHDGPDAIYTGWFWFPEKQAWGLIAKFKRPRDNQWLGGLYSFNENFGGSNGYLRRLCEFGNQWVKLTDGSWRELTTARFTHDGTGNKCRLDYGAGVVNGRFYLSNGGFVAEAVKLGDRFTRPAVGVAPEIKLP
jgi:hypothetical protein